MIPSPSFWQGGEFVPFEWERVRLDGSVEVCGDDPAGLAHPLWSALGGCAEMLPLGALPASGGYLDQPARLLEALRVRGWAVRMIEKRIEAKRG